MKKLFSTILYVVVGISYFVVLGVVGLVVNYILMVYSSISIMIISFKNRKIEWTLLDYIEETLRYFFATQRDLGMHTISEKCTEEYLLD